MTEVPLLKARSLLNYFGLLFVISVPFWILGALIDTGTLPINLPASALMTFNPMIAALFLTYQERGMEGVKQLLRRILDYDRIQVKLWYLPVFLLMPLILIVVYELMKLTGRSVPSPQINPLMLPVMFAAFFVGGVGEELGWMGYAYPRLEKRYDNALQSGVILGTVWAVWHILPFFQTHNPPNWVFWQSVQTVGTRVLIVWLYRNTGESVFAATCFHSMVNVSMFSFPVNGSHYDPFLTSLLVWSTLAGVTLIEGSKTLTRGQTQ